MYDITPKGSGKDSEMQWDTPVSTRRATDLLFYDSHTIILQKEVATPSSRRATDPIFYDSHTIILQMEVATPSTRLATDH